MDSLHFLIFLHVDIIEVLFLCAASGHTILNSHRAQWFRLPVERRARCMSILHRFVCISWVLTNVRSDRSHGIEWPNVGLVNAGFY
jgi:hypothetical protein